MAPHANDHHRAVRASLPGGALLYDPDAVAEPSAALLDPAAHGAPRGESGRGGRGAVWYVQGPFGEAVLRHYRRGGAVARVNRDRYLFRGEGRTRPFREFQLLQRLRSQGLPAPRPLAAGYRRDGIFYRADILTQRIAGAQSLAERLHREAMDEGAWRRVGQTLARFHDAGAFHADLNAHNLLFDRDAAVWLIDFDRGELRRPGRWRAANLERLQRSLRKLSAAGGRAFDQQGWNALRAAYADGAAT